MTALPDELRNRRHGVARIVLEELPVGDKIDACAVVQFVEVNATGDEKGIDADIDSARNVGAHGV